MERTGPGTLTCTLSGTFNVQQPNDTLSFLSYGPTTGLILRRPGATDVVLTIGTSTPLSNRVRVQANGGVLLDGATLYVQSAGINKQVLAPLAIGFFGATPVGQQSVTALTNNSGGTASDTIAAAGASYNQTDENNFRASVATKINQIRAALVAYGLIV
jgi:hypothetical protein